MSRVDILTPAGKALRRKATASVLASRCCCIAFDPKFDCCREDVQRIRDLQRLEWSDNGLSASDSVMPE
jgi:hypothetical protein